MLGGIIQMASWVTQIAEVLILRVALSHGRPPKSPPSQTDSAGLGEIPG